MYWVYKWNKYVVWVVQTSLSIIVNYYCHRELTLDCTLHSKHLVWFSWLCHIYVFCACWWKQEELIVHKSAVWGMQIETVANGISTISSPVSTGVAQHWGQSRHHVTFFSFFFLYLLPPCEEKTLFFLLHLHNKAPKNKVQMWWSSLQYFFWTPINMLQSHLQTQMEGCVYVRTHTSTCIFILISLEISDNQSRKYL